VTSELQTTATINIAPSEDAAVKGLVEQAMKLRCFAETRIILNNDDLKPATEDLSVIAGLKKALKEKRGEYESPIKSHLDLVKHFFEQITLPLDEADKITRQKILTFKSEQERKRLEAEETNRMAQEVARRQAQANGGDDLMTTQEVIRFKRDTPFRNNLFTPESYAHPAKMDAQLLMWIVEHFTKAGDTILDPMFGSGTSMLACLFGRNVIGVELEQKFVTMAKANWAKVSCRPQLGVALGTCQILQGDARNLTGLLADAIVTSPPYAEVNHHTDNPDDLLYLQPGRKGRLGGTAGGSPDNLGNLPYGEISAIVTSPPYEASVADGKEGPGVGGSETQYGRWQKGTATKNSYTEHGEPTKVDAVVTSPPYSEVANASKNTGSNLSKAERLALNGERNGTDDEGMRYSQSSENIGNLKSTSYLDAMLQVYRQCHAVLRPGGVMVLVTKNFIRDKKEIRLDLDTIKLCEAAGFTFQERFYRELPAQSFWRILYKQKYPDAPELKYEDVLVLASNHSKE